VVVGLGFMVVINSTFVMEARMVVVEQMWRWWSSVGSGGDYTW